MSLVDVLAAIEYLKSKHKPIEGDIIFSLDPESASHYLNNHRIQTGRIELLEKYRDHLIETLIGVAKTAFE